MRKLWVIARGEYFKIVRKRSFVLGTIAIPLFFIAIMVLSVAFAVGGTDGRPIGYVDQAGVLAAGVTPTENSRGDKLIEIRQFTDEAAARSALDGGQIQA
jgi:ABC-type Na+ efflux pump permease subunit